METNVGMVFVIIFTVITMVFLFAFGMQRVGSIFDIGSTAKVQRAVDDLEKTVNEVYEMAEGSSKTVQLQIPKTTKICFIDPKNPEKRIYSSSDWKNWDPETMVINSMIKNPNDPNYLSNVWIYYKKESTGEGYKIRHLYPRPEGGSNGNFCAIDGATLYLENKGTYVEISVQ